MARIAKRLALVCVALLTMGAGAAYATGTLGSLVGADGTISACVQKASGNLKIVSPGNGCDGHGEIALSWNQQGPKGDQGEKGDTGPAGADGAGLVGSACSLPNGTAGTVQERVDPSGMILFICHTESSGSDGNGDGDGSGEAGTGYRCPIPLPGYAHATTNCDPASGEVSLACDQGWGDLDGDITTGCEDDVTTDARNCGWVGNDVTHQFMHAIGGCVEGSAVLLACDPGWIDANGYRVDGCELAADSYTPTE